ncbi:hypothetical protein JCM19037_3689 [Geomicrobium sp. JCM 19037]|nr:hypothetical protein JCM19037_3689 [Geomicrobium sp. JCM 19037]
MKGIYIDNFLFDWEINDDGEILLRFQIEGVEHSLGITERDASRFLHLFQMKALEKYKF